MELYLSALKRQLLPAAAMGVVYLAVLLTMIVICNSNSLIHYETAPYEYGSEPIDFFF